MSWIHIGMHVWIHMIELILICSAVKGERKESTFAYQHHVGMDRSGRESMSIRVRVGVRVVVEGRIVPG
jgi:hypothetical protein